MDQPTSAEHDEGALRPRCNTMTTVGGVRRRSAPVGAVACLLAVLGASACGGATPRRVPASTTSTGPSGAVPTTAPSTTVTTTEAVTAGATVSPDQGVAGTALVFTVTIRGPGTLGGEGVMFGDGGTSGANAGDIGCGATARADHTSSYTHVYGRPGTFEFSDQVTVQAPAPSCVFEHTTARITVVVAAPLSDATLNGAFVSPTKNIACYIDPASGGSLRCATFSPPRLVTMDATGSVKTCSGPQCNLGNPAMETPVLPYGSATAGGPFQCLATEQAMLCTVIGHKGFALSRSGVQTIH